MTTPRTLPGKICLIGYGFLGCSGAILFFNLFLERIISFWAFILRFLHQAKIRNKGGASSGEKTRTYRRDSCMTLDEDSLDQWKPSVYKVQFLLFVTSCIIALTASALYHPMEQWNFFDCIYFCFVAFATIGFGDYVSSQNTNYPQGHWYRFANFLFLVLGCCCIYSFFNVTSLVLRTVLDLVIRKLDIDCSQVCSALNCCSRKARSVPPLGSDRPRNRRNAIAADQVRRVDENGEDDEEAMATGNHRSSLQSAKRKSADSTYASDQSVCSNELISMQDFFQTNQVALAMIQKQLWETSQRSKGYHVHEGFEGGVGPLAIVDQYLGQDNI